MNLANPKKPIADGLQRIDLDQIWVIEHLGNHELVLSLLEELEIVPAADWNDFQGITLGIGMATDLQNRAVGAGPKRVQDIKLPDRRGASAHTIPKEPMADFLMTSFVERVCSASGAFGGPVAAGAHPTSIPRGRT